MPYSEELAERIGNALASRDDVVQKKMFGGIAFMVNGNMACGVVRDDLMVRVGAEGHGEAISQPYAREMDFTGRPMKGMIYVAAEGTELPPTEVGGLAKRLQMKTIQKQS